MAQETVDAGRSQDGTPGSGVVLCEVFRSPRREGMYLFVARSEGLARVPAELLEVFGTPQSALVFRLHAQRPLARVAAEAVLAALEEKGFYLQMPPVPGADTPDGAATDAAIPGPGTQEEGERHAD